MNFVRNKLYHVSFISIQRGMTTQDFLNELRLMIKNFKKHGADKILLEKCKNNI